MNIRILGTYIQIDTQSIVLCIFIKTQIHASSWLDNLEKLGTPLFTDTDREQIKELSARGFRMKAMGFRFPGYLISQ